MDVHLLVYFHFSCVNFFGVDYLGHIYLAFNETANRFSKCLYYFTFPPTIYQSSHFSTFSSSLVITCVFCYTHFSLCEVVFCCGFILHFVKLNEVEHHFRFITIWLFACEHPSFSCVSHQVFGSLLTYMNSLLCFQVLKIFFSYFPACRNF